MPLTLTTATTTSQNHPESGGSVRGLGGGGRRVRGNRQKKQTMDYYKTLKKKIHKKPAL